MSRTKTPKPDTLFRRYRGSGWTGDDAVWVRAVFCDWSTPAFWDYDLGFRCAQRCRQQILKVQP